MMRQNKKICAAILSLLFILHGSMTAQSHYGDKRPWQQPLLMDTLHHQLNFYDLAHNPAALFEDEQKRSLQIRQDMHRISGSYRLPFAPQEVNDQHYFVQHIQPLSEHDLFKGYFAYHRKRDTNVKWLDQDGYSGQNPFLFADSSNGDFILNGLYWSAAWAHRFNSRWLSGASFYYNVDQRLKQVFPKPLNKHRDLQLDYGLQYQQKNWKLGFSYSYRDNQEKIEISKYNLRQDLSPLIYKFRFSDLPVILRGKTSEERQINKHGHVFSVQLKKTFSAGSWIICLSHLHARGNIADGGNRNDQQGNFVNTIESVSGLLNYRFSILEGLLKYRYKQRRFTAFHPDFEFTIWKAPSEAHRLTASLMTNSWSSLPLFLDLGYALYTENRVDFMSVNHWRFRRQQKFIRSGFIWRLHPAMDLASWFTFDDYHFSNKERTHNFYSDYFKTLYDEPYVFFTNLQAAKTGALQFVYHYGPMMDFEIFLLHRSTNGQKKTRREWLLSTALKIYIF